jgi:ABC-type Zn uptake system ZnuABC Zn-binding protein ZnuA
LQEQLDAAEADLAQAQQALAQVSSRITSAGINVSERGLGVTPQAGIEILAARVREIQAQLEELADLARQNDIAPGVLRG